MKQHVLFIHGGGDASAYDEDALLAASLRDALGAAYAVRYPRMPLEENAEYADWKTQITAELSAMHGDVMLVAHSVGGSILLKYLAEERVAKPIAGLFLLAVPYFGGDEIWNYPEMTFPPDVATTLAAIPHIYLYHSRDDAVVPFAHLGLYAAQLPQATARALDGRGHQFGNELADVAADMRRAAMAASG